MRGGPLLRSRGPADDERHDDVPAGTWNLDPSHSRAGDSELSQNFATAQVLFGAKLTADVTRTSTRLTWTATATTWWAPRDNGPRWQGDRLRVVPKSGCDPASAAPHGHTGGGVGTAARRLVLDEPARAGVARVVGLARAESASAAVSLRLGYQLGGTEPRTHPDGHHVELARYELRS